MTYEYVDIFKVGKWSHDTQANDINWKQFATQAVDLLESLGKEYYIKQDLKKYLG